ncbi:hypothetical protein XENOCAPTIV_016895, partial [Xenoophorus captivus]
CLMTLVAMALQGCGGAGREGVLSGVGARMGRWSSDPESAVDMVGLGELIHTRASAASRSVYSKPEEQLLVPLETDCSLSCLLLFRHGPHWSICSA